MLSSTGGGPRFSSGGPGDTLARIVYPLVEQLRCARAELLRGLGGLSGDDACRRIGPMNSIGWNVGHLA
jgi:hypothetical protein